MFTTVENQLHESGYDIVGVSYGIANGHESDDSSKLMALADMRMYEMKTNRKKNRGIVY